MESLLTTTNTRRSFTNFSAQEKMCAIISELLEHHFNDKIEGNYTHREGLYFVNKKKQLEQYKFRAQGRNNDKVITERIKLNFINHLHLQLLGPKTHINMQLSLVWEVFYLL